MSKSVLNLLALTIAGCLISLTAIEVHSYLFLVLEGDI